MFAPTVVEAQQRQALPYGLFTTFSFRETGDGRWLNGVTWESLSCDPASGIGDPDCEASNAAGNTVAVGLPKGDAEKAGNGEASPFTVYFKEKCDPVGRVAIAQERATQSLLLKEQTRVEQAFWTGDLDNTPNLRESNPDIILGGTPFGVVEGLAYLEFFNAQNFGSLGTIHMTRGMALEGLSKDALVVQGDRLFTALGTPVAAGAGYDGEGPTGSAPTTRGQSWAYITPPLFGYRSEVFTSSERPGDLMDRAVNDYYGVAERTYLLGYDPCGTAAALLTIESASGGGGGNAEVLAAIADSQAAVLANDDANLATLQGNITSQTTTLQGNITSASNAIQANDDGNTTTITGAVTSASTAIQANDDTNTADILAAINPPA